MKLYLVTMPNGHLAVSIGITEADAIHRIRVSLQTPAGGFRAQEIKEGWRWVS